MLRTTTERDPDIGVISVELIGDLGVADYSTARKTIGKAVAECPAAVLVDLSAMRCADTTRLNIFAAITYEAQTTWGVPVLLCGAGPHVRRELAAFRTFVALYEHRSEALVAVHAYVPRWLRQDFLPIAASAGAAREVVGEACTAWDLGHLRDTALLVTSELATNAIVHTRTTFDLLTGYTGRFLRVAVRDRSRQLPRITPQAPVQSTIMTPGSGRGLRIIAALATHWGVTELCDGKIVWVLLRAHDS